MAGRTLALGVDSVGGGRKDRRRHLRNQLILGMYWASEKAWVRRTWKNSSPSRAVSCWDTVSEGLWDVASLRLEIQMKKRERTFSRTRGASRR